MVRVLKPVLGAVGLLIGVLFAGCLEVPAPPCSEEPCTDLAMDDTAKAVENVHFEACRGGIAGVQVPFERARDHVPLAFAVNGMTPATASLVFQVLACERLVANATVFSPAFFWKAGVFVHPTNESWELPGTHYFLLDVRASPPELAETLGGLGLPAVPASFTAETLPGLGGPAFEDWTVDGEDCDISLSFRRTGQAGLSSEGEFHHWQGGGPFLRFQAHQDYQYDAATDAAPVLAEGHCVPGEVVGLGAAYVSQAYLRFESSWSKDNQLWYT